MIGKTGGGSGLGDLPASELSGKEQAKMTPRLLEDQQARVCGSTLVLDSYQGCTSSDHHQRAEKCLLQASREGARDALVLGDETWVPEAQRQAPSSTPRPASQCQFGGSRECFVC